MNQLISKLFSIQDANVFGIMDGASCPDLLQMLKEYKVEHECLYRGALEPTLEAKAPYLVSLKRSSPLLKLWLEEGQENNWGIFAVSYADMTISRRHLRGFLRVKKPDKQMVYFRYYDPRVFDVFIHTCDALESDFIFGPIEKFFYFSEESFNEVVNPKEKEKDQRPLRQFIFRDEPWAQMLDYAYSGMERKIALQLKREYPDLATARGGLKVLQESVHNYRIKANGFDLAKYSDIYLFCYMYFIWTDELEEEGWFKELTQSYKENEHWFDDLEQRMSFELEQNDKLLSQLG
ncbi:MAG: DUF4123 domain-containing protein [Lentisphaeraceae bacterium]|nr:DUF4123 domain-containing protein [Lentisphaeraceae bacterium]